MRKLQAIILISFFALILAACGAGDMPGYYIADYEIAEEYYAVYDYEEIEQEQYLTQQELFLQDLDYMLYVLENNFALFDAAYWARGADIRAIIDGIRVEVLNYPDMTIDEFFVALNRNFSPLFNVGHFGILRPHMHYNILSNRQGWEWRLYPRSTQARWSYPHVLEFYELRRPTAPRCINVRVADFNKLEGEARIRSVINTFILYGERELAYEIDRLLMAGRTVVCRWR